MVATVPKNEPASSPVELKNRAGDFFWPEGKNAGFNRAASRNPRRENGDMGTTRASGVRFFGFRYYSADMGRFIHADPLEERGAWTLYSDLSYGTTNPFFGSSGLGGKGWLSEWEQVQDGLTRNASFSHSTEEIQFSTLRNSETAEGVNVQFSSNINAMDFLLSNCKIQVLSVFSFTLAQVRSRDKFPMNGVIFGCGNEPPQQQSTSSFMVGAIKFDN